MSQHNDHLAAGGLDHSETTSKPSIAESPPAATDTDETDESDSLSDIRGLSAKTQRRTSDESGKLALTELGWQADALPPLRGTCQRP